jgi:hypothetical protein
VTGGSPLSLPSVRAGAPFTGLGSRIAEALLVYLAMHGGPLNREHVAELLWPDRAAGAARTSLRSCLYLVTRVLGPVVHATHSTVAAGPGLVLDVWVFERLVAGGRLVEARTLYRGPFLDGFYLPARSAFEDWVEFEAQPNRRSTSSPSSPAGHRTTHGILRTSRRSARSWDAASCGQSMPNHTITDR